MEKIAAIDVGLKRIGLAFCFDGSVIIPQNAVIRRGRNQAARDLSTILNEWGIRKLIVGLPKEGGSAKEMERRIKHFVSLLDIDDIEEVIYVDEAFSSQEAKEQMVGITKQKRDGKIDSLAAKIILERYLDSLRYSN